jgi:hypothetical protein
MTTPQRRSLPVAFALALALTGPLARAQSPRAPATPPISFQAFGATLVPEASWEYTHERRDNFDLRDARERDRRIDEHELKLGLGSQIAPDTKVYLQATGLIDVRATQGSAIERSADWGRGETWVKWSALAGSPWSLQVGRVSLTERRAWWWDEDLDAVRLGYEGSNWTLDTGLARELGRVYSKDPGIDPAQRGVNRLFGQASWKVAPRHTLDAFWLLARDGSGVQATPQPDEDATDPSDLRANWFGWRASGDIRPENGYRLGYWADTAWLRGKETVTSYEEDGDGRLVPGRSRTRTVRGNAWDLGATLSLPLALEPRLSLGLAQGSGGVRSSSVDRNFRQTGLQENRARIGGIKRVHRYGELLQPELSNLRVLSLGAGLRLNEEASVELLVHRLRQVTPSAVFSGARLSTDPAGRDVDLGREIDLLLALRHGRHVEFTLSLSRFKPGTAFAPAERDAAHGLELGLSLSY